MCVLRTTPHHNLVCVHVCIYVYHTQYARLIIIMFVCICVYIMCITQCLFKYMYILASRTMPHHHHICVYMCVYVCHTMFACICVHTCITHNTSSSPCLCAYVYIHLSRTIFVCVCVCTCITHLTHTSSSSCLCAYVYIRVSHTIFVCICVYTCIPHNTHTSSPSGLYAYVYIRVLHNVCVHMCIYVYHAQYLCACVCTHTLLQGGEEDPLSCRSFFAKESLIIGLFCGK